MLKTDIPSRDAIREAIAPEDFRTGRLGARTFAPGDTVYVYFMQESTPEQPFVPYSDAVIAANPDIDLRSYNSTYRFIRGEDQQNVLDNVFALWSQFADIRFQKTTVLTQADIRVGIGSGPKGVPSNILPLDPSRPGTSWNDVYIPSIYYNPSTRSDPIRFTPGSRETTQLLHEVGHSIGLEHPAVTQEGRNLAGRIWWDDLLGSYP